MAKKKVKQEEVKQEVATVTFNNGNGDQIKFDLKLNEKNGQVELHNDFGDKKPEEHTGFYAHLAHGFFTSLVGEENLPKENAPNEVN